MVKFYRKKLKSGLTVLFEKRDLPVVTVCFASRYGSGYETLEQKGIAHFIEHMLFKGTVKRTAEQISGELEKIGGLLNAFTADEATGVHVKLPSRHLAKGIDVLSDIFFNPLIDEKEMEKERKVILEEIKLHHDSPERHVFDEIRACEYKKPFGASPAGTEKTLGGMKRKDLIEIHRNNYVPENSLLCVVGKADFEEICRLAEKIRGRGVNQFNKVRVERLSGQRVEKRKDINQSALILSIPANNALDSRRYAFVAFKTILGDGLSSRLFKEIREKRGLAYGVRAFEDFGRDFGDLLFYVGTEKGKEEEVKNLILVEMRKMKNLGKKELEEVKEQLIGNYEIFGEDSFNVCTSLIMEEVIDRAENYYSFVEKVNEISLEEIRKIADFKDYSFFALVPE